MTGHQQHLFEILAGPVVPKLSAVLSPISTRWVTVTGSPGSGKTTTCDNLDKAGYCIIPEASRAAINEAVQHGYPVEEIFTQPMLLSLAILVRKLAIAQSLSPAESLIWDTGLGDALLFCRLANADVSKYRPTLLSYRFREVIMLEPLRGALIPNDAIRPQTEAERAMLHSGLLAEYEAQGYTINRILTDSASERIRVIRRLLK
jgi:predicted ATPase